LAQDGLEPSLSISCAGAPACAGWGVTAPGSPGLRAAPHMAAVAAGPGPAGMDYGRAEIWAAGLASPARAGEAETQDDSPPILTVLPERWGTVNRAQAPPQWLNLKDPDGAVWGPEQEPPKAPPQAPPQAPAQAPAQAQENVQCAPAWAATRNAPGAPTRARQLYDYSTREVWYASNVPVPEQNQGVVITAEFPTHPSQECYWKDGGRMICYTDQAVRNAQWSHGHNCLPHVDPVTAATAQQRRPLVLQGNEMARDVKGIRRQELQGRPHYQRERHLPHDYGALLLHRKDEGWKALAEKVKHSLEREILTADEMQDFFMNEEAVMYERVDYWNVM